MSLKAIVFDFDGTLLESAEIKTDAFGELFRDHPEQVPEIIAYHRAHEGISRFVKFRTIYREILKRPLDEDGESSLGVAFSRLIATKMIECPLVSGAQAFLEQVAVRYKCFVASGTPHEELRAIIARRGIEKYFIELHGSPRSKEEILRGILERHALAPAEVLSIGDAVSDLQAARAEHVPFAGRVRQGSPPVFPEGSTVGLFHDYEELMEQWNVIEVRAAVR